jgi:hypothetical protein
MEDFRINIPILSKPFILQGDLPAPGAVVLELQVSIKNK